MTWNKLYTLPGHNVLYVTRKADECWNYTLYHSEIVGVYEVTDNGLFAGYQDLPVDTIADYIALNLQLDGRPRRTCITFREFSEMIVTRPVRAIRVA